jgi:hypothetical protein
VKNEISSSTPEEKAAFPENEPKFRKNQARAYAMKPLSFLAQKKWPLLAIPPNSGYNKRLGFSRFTLD